MGVSRRDFLKIGGTAAVASTVVGLSPHEARANQRENRLKGAKVSTSICPYCAVGCGMLVHSKNNKVISIEGDPEHPISQGNLCSKGAALQTVIIFEENRSPTHAAQVRQSDDVFQTDGLPMPW